MHGAVWRESRIGTRWTAALLDSAPVAIHSKSLDSVLPEPFNEGFFGYPSTRFGGFFFGQNSPAGSLLNHRL